MKKIIVSVVSIFVLMFLLVSCQGEGGKSTNPTVEQPSTSTSTTTNVPVESSSVLVPSASISNTTPTSSQASSTPSTIESSSSANQSTNVTLSELETQYGVKVTLSDGTFEPNTEFSCSLVTDTEEINSVKELIKNVPYIKESGVILLDCSLSLNGEHVQPGGEVKVTIPLNNLNLDTNKEYLLLHIQYDNTVANVEYEIKNDTLEFTTSSFSYFVIVEGEHVHTYSDMVSATPATFLSEGNIEYCECTKCHKYFDSLHNELDSVVIPKLSTEISLYINGEKKGDFTVTEENQNHVAWELTGIDVNVGNVVTIRDKADSSIIYDYFTSNNSNVTDQGQIHNDATNVTFNLNYTPNGLMCIATGYEATGVLLQVTNLAGTSTSYQMNHIVYNFGSEHDSYVYGYIELQANELFNVRDCDHNKVYNFDNLAESSAANSALVSEGTDKWIKVNRTGRYGIELLNGKLLVDTIYAPSSGGSYSLELKGEAEKAPLTKETLNPESNDYKNATYALFHETTINATDVKDFVTANGYEYFTKSLNLTQGNEIRIVNNTTNEPIDALNLVSAYDMTSDDYEIADGYIKIKADGLYTLIYVESANVYSISKYKESIVVPIVGAPVMHITDGTEPKSVTMEVTGSPTVYKCDNYTVEASSMLFIIYNNQTYADVETGSDLITVITSGTFNLVMFNASGSYNFTFYTETGKIGITKNASTTPVTYTYALRNLAASTERELEATTDTNIYTTNYDLEMSGYYTIVVTGSDNSEGRYVTLDSASSSLGTSYSTSFFMVNKNGNYNITFNISNNTIGLTLVEEKPSEPDYDIKYYVEGTSSSILFSGFVADTENPNKLVYTTAYAIYAYDTIQVYDKNNSSTKIDTLYEESDYQYVIYDTTKSAFRIKVSGLYQFIFYKDTLKLDFVYVRALEEDEILIPSSIYISATNRISLDVYPHKENTLYVDNFDSSVYGYTPLKFKAATNDVDADYIHDLTLASDYSFATTDGTTLMINSNTEKYMIYIDTHTHRVVIREKKGTECFNIARDIFYKTTGFLIDDYANINARIQFGGYEVLFEMESGEGVTHDTYYSLKDFFDFILVLWDKDAPNDGDYFKENTNTVIRYTITNNVLELIWDDVDNKIQIHVGSLTLSSRVDEYVIKLMKDKFNFEIEEVSQLGIDYFDLSSDLTRVECGWASPDLTYDDYIAYEEKIIGEIGQCDTGYPSGDENGRIAQWSSGDVERVLKWTVAYTDSSSYSHYNAISISLSPSSAA